ncbi:hypothetical protein Bca4012_027695 [Brassica carinata]
MQQRDLSDNQLTGSVPDNGSFSLFTSVSFANNLDPCGPVTSQPMSWISPVLSSTTFYSNSTSLHPEYLR